MLARNLLFVSLADGGCKKRKEKSDEMEGSVEAKLLVIFSSLLEHEPFGPLSKMN